MSPFLYTSLLLNDSSRSERRCAGVSFTLLMPSGTFLSQSVVDHARPPKHVGGAGLYTYVNIDGDTYPPTFLPWITCPFPELDNNASAVRLYSVFFYLSPCPSYISVQTMTLYVILMSSYHVDELSVDDRIERVLYGAYIGSR